ncbi:glycosyltransferase [Candidatus Electronema sp. PJ]|uniref:glycosyltransferase n=1 Tax=Candidatus Electronema sp. PJ TaxID=3401572 RepID=UPI003AA997EF
MPAEPRKPVIALLLPNLAGGGAERANLYLAQEFLARGYEVDLVLMQRKGELLPLLPARVQVIDLATQQIRKLLRPLTAYIQQRQPDAVLATMWPLTSMAVLCHKLARLQGRLVVAEQNVLSPQYAEWGHLHNLLLRTSIASTYPWADARIGVSEGVVDDLAALSGIKKARFEVVYNPVPRPEPASNTALAQAEQCWGKRRGPRILTVGSLKAQKNQALLIRAFAQAFAQSNADLLILGEGQLRHDLEALAAQEGVSNKVHLPGFFSDPTPFYQTADLFVLSSDYEGLPTVLIEALACGLPVVATQCPAGPAEILDNGRWGCLVPVGNVAALAAAMLKALSRPHDREALQRRAATFSPSTAANRYLELLFPGTRVR